MDISDKMNKIITFEGEKYKIKNKTKTTITLELFNEFEEYDLESLANELACTEEELESAEENASEYQKRIDEFIYCGYNEEDPDFHGMCLHQNGLDKEVKKLEDKKDKIRKEIEKRLNNYDNEDEILEVLEKYYIEF